MTKEILTTQSVIINGMEVTKNTLTRYGYPTEFVKIDGVVMMRADNPNYGTWPIELIDESGKSYCLCGAEIPEDDPYDGYCADCG